MKAEDYRPKKIEEPKRKRKLSTLKRRMLQGLKNGTQLLILNCEKPTLQNRMGNEVNSQIEKRRAQITPRTL
jgi:hypothetical protein